MYTIFRCFENDKFMIKFIVQFCFEFSEIKKACNNSWDLCLTNLTRWQVEHESTYFLTSLFMLFQKYFLFNKFSVLSCSKWSTYESSWFCFRSFFLSKFEKIYHLFFQRNKSFSIFHLKKKSRSTFLRVMFNSTSSRLINHDVRRFRSLCHASSMLFRQKIVFAASTNQIIAE